MHARLGGLAVALVFVSAAGAEAAIFTVTKTADTADGLCSVSDCSLREAAIAANANAGADEIVVPSGTYPLTLVGSGASAGDLDLLDEVSVHLSAGAVDPAVIQAAPGWRVVLVGAITATLADLVLEGGSALGGATGTAGGGVYVVDGGTLTLLRCEVRDNQAAFLGGGGIYFNLSASGTLVDSAVTGNSVSEAGAIGGGGIRSGGLGSLTLLRSSVDGNSTSGDGGGLYARGTVVIERSTVNGNSAGGTGGGLYVGGVAGETTTVLESTVAANNAGGQGGGFVVIGSLALRRSLVGNNTAAIGGGIRLLGQGLEVEGSTFVLNRASGSGGALSLSIGSSVPAGIFNSTIALNVADSDGNGVGQGGGLYVDGLGSPAALHGALLANNLRGSAAAANDCVGEVDSLGYNLIETAAGCTISGITTGNVTGQDPLLTGVGGYGGPTLSFELLPGSPALDAGDPAGCSGADGLPVAADQRGFTRHLDGDQDGDVRCDIGAVEHSLFADGFESGDSANWSAIAP